MKKRKLGTRGILRLIALVMFLIAVVFVFCALSNPALGSAFYIFGIRIGADVWRAFYKLYAIVVVALFVISFFVKNRQQ